MLYENFARAASNWCRPILDSRNLQLRFVNAVKNSSTKKDTPYRHIHTLHSSFCHDEKYSWRSIEARLDILAVSLYYKLTKGALFVSMRGGVGYSALPSQYVSDRSSQVRTRISKIYLHAEMSLHSSYLSSKLHLSSVTATSASELLH